MINKKPEKSNQKSGLNQNQKGQNNVSETNQKNQRILGKKSKKWQKAGIVVLGLLLIYIFISSFFCLRSDPDFTKDQEYISCSQDSDCTARTCGCLNEKGAKNFSLWTTFCGGGLMCKIPSSCTCQNGQCISNYDYEDEEFYKKTDTEKIEDVFMMRLEAQKNCDIELSNSIITEKSKEIIHSTCSNMANERKCYVRKDFKILAKSDTAILYFPPFNHKTGWPFFFAKEDGKWKIDMHKMAFGITMGGSGCATGWGWRDDEIVEEFCGYFEEGECPEKR